LLAYVVETFLKGDTGGLKEVAIGVAVFDRPPDYDPKIDSVVRTEVRRLREHLRDYYESEGAESPLIISLPKGGYIPSIVRRPALAAEPAAARRKWSSRWFLVAVSVSAVALGAVLLRPLRPDADLAPPVAARVVVLEFQGPAGETQLEPYGRMLMNGIVARLAEIEGLRIVPSSARWMSSGEETAAKFATRLNSDYVVTGAFTNDSDQGSVWVRVVEARGGSVLLARKFDFSWADLERTEDQIASVLESALSRAVHRKARSADGGVSPEAYEALLQGHYAYIHYRQSFQPEAGRTAERSLERALNLEPGYADALGLLAQLKVATVYPWNDRSAQKIKEAENLAKAALKIEPQHVRTLAAMSSVNVYQGRLREALDYAMRAYELEHRNPVVLNQLAEVYEALGFYESSTEVYDRCLREEPVVMDPYIFGALPLVRLGRYAEAIDWVHRFRAIDPVSVHVVGIEAYALIRQGKPSEAEERLLRSRNSVADRFADSPDLAHWFSYLDYSLALAQVRQGRTNFGREVVRRHGLVSRRSLDDVILLTAALGMPQAAVENIDTNPFYRNYRYLVSEPGLEPLYDEPEFRKLLSQTYSEWNRMLADYGDSLPVRPPELPSPDEFVEEHASSKNPS
jgi:TolB-like protein/Flp pilus assembly protein TadD